MAYATYEKCSREANFMSRAAGVITRCPVCGVNWFDPCACGVEHFSHRDLVPREPGGPVEDVCVKCAAAHPPEVLRAKVFAARCSGKVGG